MKRALVSLFIGSFLIAAGGAHALPDYALLIPNAATNVCGNCHVNPAGGGPRNGFGQDFANNAHTWNNFLAILDSDVDGVSNGVELQDPDGTWLPGQPDPGEACLVSNPGDALDLPTPVADVTLAYGGGVVTPGTNIDFTADLFVDDCYAGAQTFDVWIDVKLPSGSEYGPVFGPMNLTLPPGFSVTGFSISLFVPPPAPAGTYTMLARTGTYPGTIDDESTFTFDVAP